MKKSPHGDLMDLLWDKKNLRLDKNGQVWLRMTRKEMRIFIKNMNRILHYTPKQLRNICKETAE